MSRFHLPPGCRGFRCEDGSTADASASGGTVTLEGPKEKALLRSQYAEKGLVTAESFSLGTKTGRWCRACRFLAQGWSLTCPKCGRETVPEK